jgi:hypothetical protein
MRLKLLFLIFLFLSLHGFSQEEPEPSGKPFATIYARAFRGFSGNAANQAAFELVRGYLGYEYTFSPEFFARINLDIGSANDLPLNSNLKRYAFFKNAYLRYSHQKLAIEFGMISLKQFKLQETVWERRYLMKTIADEYKLGYSADLGVNFHYKFNEFIDANFTIMNGEGYQSLQMDDIFKYSFGTTIKAPRNFTSRFVYDITHNKISETTLLAFTSYDFRGKWNLAAEFVLRQNQGWLADRNIQAWSFYGKYNLTEKYQLFARFDKIDSNIPKGETAPWQLAKDGEAIVAGIQFRPIPKICMALNYRDRLSRETNSAKDRFLSFDLEVKM